MNRSDHDENQTEDSQQPPTEDAPFVAKLVEPSEDLAILVPDDASPGESGEEPDGPIRVGSPFREDSEVLSPEGPPAFVPAASGEAAYGDFGPFLYTAMGASAAAVLVLFFASVGAWWFPTGGALVAVLGTVLSIVGLFSTRRFRYAAFAALPLHMALFFFSYARSLG